VRSRALRLINQRGIQIGAAKGSFGLDGPPTQVRQDHGCRVRRRWPGEASTKLDTSANVTYRTRQTPVQVLVLLQHALRGGIKSASGLASRSASTARARSRGSGQGAAPEPERSPSAGERSIESFMRLLYRVWLPRHNPLQRADYAAA